MLGFGRVQQAVLDDYTEGQIVDLLNQQGMRSGTGCAFTIRIVARLRHVHKIVSRYDRFPMRRHGLRPSSELEIGM